MDEVVQAEDVLPQHEPRKRSVLDFQSIRNLWIVIGALAFLLIVSMLWNQKPARVPVNPDDPDVAAMRAELNRQLAEFNRQRAEFNMPPLARGEDVAAIAGRLRRDAETLISLVDHYQQLVAEKDRALTEKNVELISSERVRASLTTELARVQTNNTGTASLQAELSDALSRSNRLADELAEARAVIADLFENPPTNEIESLNRRLEEAARARDFYKERAEQLAAAARNGAGSLEDTEEE